MLAVRHAQLLLLAMLTAAAPCALAAAGEGTAGGGGAADTISIVPAGEREQAAVAAVLVATLGARFGDAMLELRLGDAEIESRDPRDQVVHGQGQMRFTGGGDDWLAFRYRTRYDPVFASAGYPEITLGGDGGGESERFVPNDAGLLGELEMRVAAEFESWPGAGRVFLQFDDISSLQTGERFLRIEASGLADFGPGGSTFAHVDALYDLQSRTWLSVGHELGPNVRAHDDGGTAGP